MSKLRLLFVKEGPAAYISNLDLLRTVQRAFPRTELDIRHSQGFHPHPIISIVLPLPVGQSSDCELLDFEVTQETDGAGIAEKLNGGLPEGLTILDCYEARRPVRELTYLQADMELDYDRGVPHGAAQALTELLLEEGVPFEVYCEGESWIQRDRLEGVLAHTFSPEFRQVLREHARLPEELNAALRGRMAEKFHIFYVLPQRRKSLMERAAACGALEMVTSFAENLEFTAAGVNKGTAVQALSARLGLGPEQVMAFGDAGNDLELLAWAGWSFAMANASAEAKKAARYETGSNAEGGVGMAVERWLLAE